MRVTLLGNYFLAKFYKILIGGSLENSSFPRKQPVTNFWSNTHAWLLIGFTAKMKSMQKGFVSLGNKRKRAQKRETELF